MGLETFGFVNDLVVTNPVGASDPKSQGDDHIRGIKATLKATFPNATAAFYFPSTATKTGAYSVVAADQNKIILCDATSAAFTVGLDAVATLGSRFRVTLIKIDSSANAITIDPASSETIDGAATRALSRQYEAITLVCNGSAWYSEGLSLATTSGPGIVELATTTEVLTGTATDRGVTPDALAALWEKGADEASAGTVSFGEGGFFHITGTTTITDIDWDTAKNGRVAWVVFDGALTLTHNATTLILPGGASITTAAGDRALFVQDSSDNVYCLAYIRANGKAVVAPAFSDITGKPTTLAGYGITDADTGTYTPTITSVANLDATTAFVCAYFIIESVVTVFGIFQADATAAASTVTTCRLSLPVASNLSFTNGGGGAAMSIAPVAVTPDGTNDGMTFSWLSQSTTNQSVGFIFSYVVA